jgi:hypothetical protein
MFFTWISKRLFLHFKSDEKIKLGRSEANRKTTFILEGFF